MDWHWSFSKRASSCAKSFRAWPGVTWRLWRARWVPSSCCPASRSWTSQPCSCCMAELTASGASKAAAFGEGPFSGLSCSWRSCALEASRYFSVRYGSKPGTERPSGGGSPYVASRALCSSKRFSRRLLYCGSQGRCGSHARAPKLGLGLSCGKLEPYGGFRSPRGSLYKSCRSLGPKGSLYRSLPLCQPEYDGSDRDGCRKSSLKVPGMPISSRGM
mmetsp:Transcript_119714/g.284404  ORF Transcript_119714/g.284404 Transcript_119714/m.284404 type:complete len:217 (-) Transcript_119714:169-819(-)